MKPGRELDALVADQVMGLKRTVRIKGTVETTTIYTDSPYFNDGVSEDDMMKYYCLPLHYSTSIADAWQVVEKLQCQGHDWKWFLLLEYDNVETWDCAFHKNSKSDGGDPDIWATADTAPHAICLAALKAMGVTDEEA